MTGISERNIVLNEQMDREKADRADKKRKLKLKKSFLVKLYKIVNVR